MANSNNDMVCNKNKNTGRAQSSACSKFEMKEACPFLDQLEGTRKSLSTSNAPHFFVEVRLISVVGSYQVLVLDIRNILIGVIIPRH
mmetsp:Transcript_20051/g.22190  ORF Transcript_20051/g.22190 Transcript_20051/m.22190 type:complete len:87 (-) Transcript_20051:38-298(-)